MQRTLSLMPLLLAVSLVFTACEQSPLANDTEIGGKQNLAGRAAPPANPAIVYQYNDDSHSIYVMDSDCSHQTKVYNTGNTNVLSFASWSPSTAIVWNESYHASGTTVHSSYIRSENVTVNSSGVPVASNLTTVASWIDDTVRVNTTAWSSTSSMNKIAYTLSTTYPHQGNSYVCLISPSGGTPDTLYTLPYTSGVGLAQMVWNADDSRLAVRIYSGASWNSILIINTSTGEVTDSISVSGQIISGIDWSRASGTFNKLLFTKNDGKIYYLTPTTGSTATTNDVISNEHSGAVTFSPDNSSVLYCYNVNTPNIVESIRKINTQGSTIKTIQKPFSLAWSMNWHR